MLLAASTPGSPQRTRSLPDAKGWCPSCVEPLRPKCGEIVTWHWAHQARVDCDPWAEPETAWHLAWKNRFPADCVEIPRAGHRADVVTPTGWVIEFQHSPITPAEIREREAAYGPRLLWVFDLTGAEDRFDFRRRDYGWSFRWRHPRKSLWHVTRRMLFDIGDEVLFDCRKVHPQVPCGGWGRFIAADDFVAALTNGTRRTA